jgi:membrane-bound lytic murein transglycosylase D
MRALGEEERARLVRAAAAPGGPAGEDGEEVSPEVEAESAELEELRALEEAELDPGAQVSAELLQSLRRLGLGNPLRDRALDAFEEPLGREDAEPGELGPVVDLTAFDASAVASRYDIPVEMQPLVAQYIEFFRGKGRRFFTKWMNRTTRFLPLMQPILEEHGMPRDTVYLAMIESGFSANAYSFAHAAGPWQFIPGTGKQFGLKQDFWVDERRDPVKATVAASRYLKELHGQLGHWYLAWAGYNTGGGRVKRLTQARGTTDFWQLIEGRGLAKETQHYVPKLIAAALISKHPRAFGWSDEEFDYEPPFTFDEVELADPTDLSVVARAAGVSVHEVQELNPELKRWCTPPASEKKPYKLRLPQGSAERFRAEFPKVAPAQRLTFVVHRVKRGETLSRIAQRYGSASEAILHLNRMKSGRALKLNLELVVPVPRGRGQEERAQVLARTVAQAQQMGVQAAAPEEEVPAGTPAARKGTAGQVRTETVAGGRTRVRYTVQEGDSLWTIAQRFRVGVDDLQSWNGLGRRSKKGLAVGSTLTVWPEGARAASGERAGTVIAQKSPPPSAQGRRGPGASSVHRLQAGETLWSVAQRYGVSVEDLKRWNRIRDHRSVQAGQQLQVSAP